MCPLVPFGNAFLSTCTRSALRTRVAFWSPRPASELHKAPQDSWPSSFLLLTFVVWLFLGLVCWSPLGWYKMATDWFQQTPYKRAVVQGGCWVRSKEDEADVWVFREPHAIRVMTVLWEPGLSRGRPPGCWFSPRWHFVSKATTEPGGPEGRWEKASEDSTKLAILPKIKQFVLNKHSPDCCLWWSSWDPKMSTRIVLASVLVAFIKQRVCASPYSVPLPTHTPWSSFFRLMNNFLVLNWSQPEKTALRAQSLIKKHRHHFADTLRSVRRSWPRGGCFRRLFPWLCPWQAERGAPGVTVTGAARPPPPSINRLPGEREWPRLLCFRVPPKPKWLGWVISHDRFLFTSLSSWPVSAFPHEAANSHFVGLLFQSISIDCLAQTTLS